MNKKEHRLARACAYTPTETPTHTVHKNKQWNVKTFFPRYYYFHLLTHSSHQLLSTLGGGHNSWCQQLDGLTSENETVLMTQMIQCKTNIRSQSWKRKAVFRDSSESLHCHCEPVALHCPRPNMQTPWCIFLAWEASAGLSPNCSLDKLIVCNGRYDWKRGVLNKWVSWWMFFH